MQGFNLRELYIVILVLAYWKKIGDFFNTKNICTFLGHYFVYYLL